MEDLPPLDLLEKQEIGAWNKWRQENLDLWPDLRGAFLHKRILDQVNLSGALLSGASFDETSLVEADLHSSDFGNAAFSDAQLMRANLSGAYLTQTSFMNADMRETNLSEAHLIDTDFSGADLRGAILREVTLQRGSLSGANLSGVDLSGVHFMGTIMGRANLNGANLSGAWLAGTLNSGTDFSGTNLNNANLNGADLVGANFSSADLSGADLSGANLSEADLSGANLSGCRVYGISAWNVRLEQTTQPGLIITRKSESTVTVDDLEIAQFIYLLLNHKKLRNVFNAVTERGVLILGRFGGGGLRVLQALAAKLRENSYLPMIFDFDRPSDRNYTETVKTLAGLSRFIIADLSGPSVPQELYATVPHFKIPFAPIIEAGRRPFSMAIDLLEYPWVIRPPLVFTNTEELLSLTPSKIIAPAEEKHRARQQLLDELFRRE